MALGKRAWYQLRVYMLNNPRFWGNSDTYCILSMYLTFNPGCTIAKQRERHNDKLRFFKRQVSCIYIAEAYYLFLALSNVFHCSLKKEVSAGPDRHPVRLPLTCKTTWPIPSNEISSLSRSSPSQKLIT